ncbi:MAG: hypothetical protein IPM57_04385 [Oligoflexia bacterium]|nr:hypothetical protein [Oligoflexia bacterium]
MSILGFFLGIYLFCVALPLALSNKMGRPKQRHLNKEKTVLSMSFILPLLFLSLISIGIIGLNIAKEISDQGHGDFIYFTLIYPCVSFFIGYMYFKKMVQH